MGAWLQRRRAGCLVVVAAFWVASASGAGESWTFRTDILPVLTKAGCNAGACHGAASGQGGFRLSLLGYDAAEDHDRLAREMGGRRIDLQRPEESLLLRKASGDLDHEGGRRWPRRSESFRRIRDWIAAGTPRGDLSIRVVRLEVTPEALRFEGTNRSARLRAMATTSDGRVEDVTDWSLFSSHDEAVATVDRVGNVAGVGPGRTGITVRYGGLAVASLVTAPWRDGGGGGTDAGSGRVAATPDLDALVERELVRLGLEPGPRADAATYYRRLCLDLLGRLPTPEECREWLAGEDSDARRDAVAGALLRREEFADFWASRMGEWLGVGARRTPRAVAERWHLWLRDGIRTGKPWHAMVREMLLAEGNPAEVGAAGFYTLASDPRDIAEHAASKFLGIRISCARCHAHPEDRWTQEDYHRFAAFFARISREGGAIRPVADGEIEHPRTGLPMEPALLGEEARAVSGPGGDRRRRLAEGLAGADNPELTRAFANRVWRELMGRGLVEPPDDLRPSRPASHPELLEWLAARSRQGDNALAPLVETIVLSRAYRRASAWESGEGAAGIGTAPPSALLERFHARSMCRPLSAEVFLDAVVQVTGVGEAFEGMRDGTRAVQLPGPVVGSAALDALGRCPRERGGGNGEVAGGGMARALHLIQGRTVQGRLGSGRVAGWLERGVAPDGIVEELWLRAFSRSPSAEEKARWVNRIDAVGHRREAIEDLAWAVLNSAEFGFNH